MSKLYKLLVKMRSAILVYLTHNMALPILRVIRRPHKFPFTENELLQMPAGSLGNDLILFLQQKKLQLLPYYAKHDIKHILLQYDTTDEGEVCLQCFMLGNGHLSFPVAVTVIFGFVTMPEHWRNFINAYRRGKKSTAVKNWKWFAILVQPTKILQNKINTPANEK
jgi:Coenzyme Q (ubiquinone) biosynthesis protein Coq4